MEITSLAAAKAVTESWRRLAGALPGMWLREADGVLGMVTGLDSSALNGVWVESVDADPGDLARMLDDVAAHGVRYSLQFRPGADVDIAELAARGLTRDDDVPLMVLDGARAIGAGVVDPALNLRQLATNEGHLAARAAALGFEAPVEAFLATATDRVLSIPGVRFYLGVVEGEPVATGVGVTFGDSVGIFNVTTLPAHRRHGYGAAVTARAVADGLAAGAAWSWLQASADGYPVYERLGFRTVERWQCWVTADSNSSAAPG